MNTDLTAGLSPLAMTLLDFLDKHIAITVFLIIAAVIIVELITVNVFASRNK